MDGVTAVVDVGRTHTKLFAVDDEGSIRDHRQAATPVHAGPPYPHLDTAAIWRWIVDMLGRLGETHPVRAIVPVGYGSTAALCDEDDLVLPVMVYEAEPPADVAAAYAAEAPPYREVLAPINPGGLTLARQLFWQERVFAEPFARARMILPHPQYWAWRLSGVAASEVTSLGAQTHLWNPTARRFSTLAQRRGWAARFPRLRNAWERLGPIRAELAAATGVPPDTQVLCGIHDSSANYLRYRAAGLGQATLMSTGTWLIAFNGAFPVAMLDEGRDGVSNSDPEGRAVACSRFMLGREHVLVAEGPGGRQAPSLADVEAVIAGGIVALPSFTDSGGPFPWTGGRGALRGPPPEPRQRAALATLYAALMSCETIEVIGARGDIVIDGPFAADPVFCALVAALRRGQRVCTSPQSEGTAIGAALLTRWTPNAAATPIALTTVAPATVAGLADYAAVWRAAVPARPQAGSATAAR